MNLDRLNEGNLADELSAIGAQLALAFTKGLPSQLPDKIQNFTTGFMIALRVYGDCRQRLGAAIEAQDVEAARSAINDARGFMEDTARFIRMSTGVDDFRHNSYVWAGKWGDRDEALSMGWTEGTPEDYQ